VFPGWTNLRAICVVFPRAVDIHCAVRVPALKALRGAPPALRAARGLDLAIREPHSAIIDAAGDRLVRVRGQTA
jgi:hypothetical protein